VNFGPDISASLQSPREGIQDTQILWAKVQKQQSYEGSNFDDDSDFLQIGELWDIYSVAFGKPSGRAISHQNFVGLSSETKKLLGDHFLNFGPDFLEIGEFWFIHFGIVGKLYGRTTRPPNIVAQSLKMKQLLGDQILNFGPDFLEISELWSTFLALFAKSVNDLWHVKILWTKVQKQRSYERKTRNLWEVWHFGGP